MDQVHHITKMAGCELFKLTLPVWASLELAGDCWFISLKHADGLWKMFLQERDTYIYVILYKPVIIYELQPPSHLYPFKTLHPDPRYLDSWGENVKRTVCLKTLMKVEICTIFFFTFWVISEVITKIICIRNSSTKPLSILYPLLS